MKKTSHAKTKKSTKKAAKKTSVAVKQGKFMIAAGVIASVALLAAAAMVITNNASAVETSTVKSGDVKDASMVSSGDPGWYKRVTGSGALDFNGTVPFNDLGNAAFTVNDPSSSVELGIYNTFPSVRFDSLGNLTYATYVPARAEKAVTLQIDIDFNVDDTDKSFQGRMVFDPAQNLALANAVDYNRLSLTADKWQEWDTAEETAKWSLTWEGNAAASAQMATNPCLADAPCTFAHIKSLFPNSGLNAGEGNSVVLRAGDGWSNLKGYADAVSILYFHNGSFAETAYNFEPSESTGGGGEEPTPNLPLSKELCYNYGWMNFDGKFKNQGQCVSYVVHSNQDL